LAADTAVTATSSLTVTAAPKSGGGALDIVTLLAVAAALAGRRRFKGASGRPW
jgi:hypothetical protein